jgi:hypothetical protein
MGEVERTGEENLDSQVTSDELKGPEDEGSLASILETPHPVFTGHPAMEEEAAGPEEETPGEEQKEEEAPEKPSEQKPERKYKSWDEAEAGAKEHQRFATEKAEEAKREREAREAAERERDELRTKMAEKKEPSETKPETVSEDQVEAKIEEALDEIAQLDEFDPDYKKKVAKAWRKAGVGNAAVSKEEIVKQVREELLAEQKAAAPTPETPSTSQTRSMADDLAGKAGLDMKEGSVDHDLFWLQVKRMPKEYDEKPFEEQVQWCVDEVKRRKGDLVKTKTKDHQKTQINNAVLERGGERPSKPAAPEPYTLGSIMNKHLERRRI